MTIDEIFKEYFFGADTKRELEEHRKFYEYFNNHFSQAYNTKFKASKLPELVFSGGKSLLTATDAAMLGLVAITGDPALLKLIAYNEFIRLFLILSSEVYLRADKRVINDVKDNIKNYKTPN